MEKTFEQEFEEYKGYHVYEIIVSGLIVLEDEGIYNHELLSKYKNCKITDAKQKAYYVADDLYKKYVEEDDIRYISVYEATWKEMRDYISEDLAVRIGVDYD